MLTMKKRGKKGTPVNLSIADDIQIVGYSMALKDRCSLTNLVERLLIQEADKRGVEIKKMDY